MYIAFFIVHSDFHSANIQYINTIQTAILNCANDNNYVHVFLASSNKVHKFDHLFKHKNITLFHKLYPTYINDIAVCKNIYDTVLYENGIDYHWIVKLRPDLVIFDRNVFVNIRSKYDNTKIHGRLRYYVGPLFINKNKRSYYDTSSVVYNKEELLAIYDHHFYLIPYTMQFFAFHTDPFSISTNNNTLSELLKQHVYDTNIQNIYSLINQRPLIHELIQTLVWSKYKLAVKITEFNVVSVHNLIMYNNIFYDDKRGH